MYRYRLYIHRINLCGTVPAFAVICQVKNGGLPISGLGSFGTTGAKGLPGCDEFLQAPEPPIIGYVFQTIDAVQQ